MNKRFLFASLLFIATSLVLTAQAVTIWEGGFFDNLPNDNISNRDITIASNWSSGMPGPDRQGIIPADAEFTARLPPNKSISIDFRLTIESGGMLEIDGGFSVENGGLLELKSGSSGNASISIRANGAINNFSGGVIENDGRISVTGRLSNGGTLNNYKYVFVNSPSSVTPILRNAGTLNNYNWLAISSEMEVSGSILNYADGLIEFDPGTLVTITGELDNVGGQIFAAGDIRVDDDGIIENKATFETQAGSRLFLFPRDSGNGEKFINSGTLTNSGTLQIVGGKYINQAGSSLTVTPSGNITMNDAQSSTLRNEVGGSVGVQDGGSFFIEVGIFNNLGAFVNDGTMVNRQLISNAGTFTNNNILDHKRNQEFSSAVPIVESSGHFINAGAMDVGDPEGSTRGIFRNSGLYELLGDGSLDITTNGQFDNEICGGVIHEGLIINRWFEGFRNMGHLDDANGQTVAFDILDYLWGFRSAVTPGQADVSDLSRVYVNVNATGGTKSGRTWGNAITNLQIALQQAKCNPGIQEIWVAQGGYRPSEDTQFVLPGNLKLIGGFTGTETEADLARPFENNTRLNGWAARRIVRYRGENNTILQGFDLVGGNAAGTGSRRSGGAVWHSGSESSPTSNLTFNSCIFRSNSSQDFGGAVYTSGVGGAGRFAITTFNNCIFWGNSTKWGGAVSVDGSNGSAIVRLNNCTLYENSASSGGAHIRGFEGGVEADNTIFWNPQGNSSISLFAPTNDRFRHCIITDGHAGGTNILTQNPQFVDPANRDFQLLSTSPAIDAGMSGLPTDALGVLRPSGNGWDLGAFEFGGVVLPVEFIAFSAQAISKNRVDLRWETGSEVDNDYFTVERSGDGQTFRPLVDLIAAGNSSTVQGYLAEDTDPLPGRSYYRIKQTDYDGTFSYSEVRTVQIAQADLTVYPNPTSDRFTLQSDASLIGQGTLRVFNQVGQLMGAQTIERHPQRSFSLFELGAKMPGVYWVEVSASDQVLREKVVRQ